jgi:hypothetical protein
MAFDLESAEPKKKFDLASATGGQAPEKQESASDKRLREESGFTSFGRGMGLSAAETVIGLGDLAGVEIEPVTRNALKMWRDDVEKTGGYGSAGQSVGELMQLAIPFSRAAKLGTGGAIAADVGLSAAHAGIQAPDDVEDIGLEGMEKLKNRAGEAAEGGAWALGGAGAGKALEKTVKGIAKTDAAQELIKKGVELTPAQASEGGLPKALEYVMAFTPFLAGGTKKLRDKANVDFNKSVLQEAAPVGKEISEIGTKGGKQLKTAFDDRYSEAWKRAGIPDTGKISDLASFGVMAKDQLGEATSGTFNKIQASMQDMVSDFTPEKLKSLDNLFRKEMKSASSGANPNMDLADSLKEMRKQLRSSVDPKAQEILSATDKQYGKYLTVKKAGAKANKNDGVFTPSQLSDSSKSVGGETSTFVGESPIQAYATQGIDTLEQKMPNPIVDAIKGVSQNIYSPQMPLRVAGRAMMGENIAQRGVKKGSGLLADALRKGGINPLDMVQTGALMGASQNE